MKIIIDKAAIKELIDTQPELFVELEGGIKAAVEEYLARNKSSLDTAVSEAFTKYFGSRSGDGFQLSPKAVAAVGALSNSLANSLLANNDRIALMIAKIIDAKMEKAISDGVDARLKQIRENLPQ